MTSRALDAGLRLVPWCSAVGSMVRFLFLVVWWWSVGGLSVRGWGLGWLLRALQAYGGGLVVGAANRRCVGFVWGRWVGVVRWPALCQSC